MEHRPSILVIDDDPDMLATIRTILEGAGFDVTVTATLTAAIAKVNIASPAAIITDIYMPGGDGFELIGALRRYRLDVPVIAMSGGERLGAHDPLGIAQSLGVAAILGKPFSRKDLIATVNRVIGVSAPEDRDGHDDHGG